jgi:hypothetical protein
MSHPQCPIECAILDRFTDVLTKVSILRSSRMEWAWILKEEDYSSERSGSSCL